MGADEVWLKVGFVSQQVMEIEANPLFDELLRQICLGRKIGEDPERIRMVTGLEERSLSLTRQAREELHARQLQAHNPDLDTALVHI